jgi:hypothetical protein
VSFSTFISISILQGKSKAGMLARGIRKIHSRSRRKTGLAGIGWEKSAFIPFEISSHPQYRIHISAIRA